MVLGQAEEIVRVIFVCFSADALAIYRAVLADLP